MDPLNKVMNDLKAGGMSMELKRQNQHGILEPIKDNEMRTLGTKSKVASTAQLLQNLTPEEKVEWAIDTKDEGNELFKEEKYVEAMEKYVEALAATDFGKADDTDSQGNIDILVVPVLCNLAACSMRLLQWQKAVMFCDQVLALRPHCGKALFRRGKSLLVVGEYQSAKENLVELIEMTAEQSDLTEQEAKAVPGLIDKANQGLRKDRMDRDAMRRSLQKGFQSTAPAKPLSVEAEPEAVKMQVEPMTATEFLIYILELLARYILSFFIKLKDKKEKKAK